MTQAKDAEPIPEERALTEGMEPPAPIAVSPPTRILPTMQELGLMSAIARTMVNARGHAVPKDIDSPSKAAAVMLAGWELGLKPMTAFRHLYVVNGRTEVDAQVMMGLVKDREPDADFIFHEYSHSACKVELRRPGRTPVIVEYTAEDAKASGQLDKPGPWKQYRRDMLAWAAVKRACRLGAPDVINAIVSVDIGNMPDLIEATAGEAAALPEPAPEEVQQAMLPDEPDTMAPAPDSEIPGTVEERPDNADEGEAIGGFEEIGDPTEPVADPARNRLYEFVAEAWPNRDPYTVICNALNLPNVGPGVLEEHWFGHGGSWKTALGCVLEVRRMEVQKQVVLIDAAEKVNAYGRLRQVERENAPYEKGGGA